MPIKELNWIKDIKLHLETAWDKHTLSFLCGWEGGFGGPDQ